MIEKTIPFNISAETDRAFSATLDLDYFLSGNYRYRNIFLYNNNKPINYAAQDGNKYKFTSSYTSLLCNTQTLFTIPTVQYFNDVEYTPIDVDDGKFKFKNDNNKKLLLNQETIFTVPAISAYNTDITSSQYQFASAKLITDGSISLMLNGTTILNIPSANAGLVIPTFQVSTEFNSKSYSANNNIYQFQFSTKQDNLSTSIYFNDIPIVTFTSGNNNTNYTLSCNNTEIFNVNILNTSLFPSTQISSSIAQNTVINPANNSKYEFNFYSASGALSCNNLKIFQCPIIYNNIDSKYYYPVYSDNKYFYRFSQNLNNLELNSNTLFTVNLPQIDYNDDTNITCYNKSGYKYYISSNITGLLIKNNDGKYQDIFKTPPICATDNTIDPTNYNGYSFNFESNDNIGNDTYESGGILYINDYISSNIIASGLATRNWVQRQDSTVSAAVTGWVKDQQYIKSVNDIKITSETVNGNIKMQAISSINGIGPDNGKVYGDITLKLNGTGFPDYSTKSEIATATMNKGYSVTANGWMYIQAKAHDDR